MQERVKTGSVGYAASGLNQCTAVGDTSYSYDSRGNLTSDGLLR